MAKRARIRFEKKETSADGSIPRDSAGQPDRRWMAVTTVYAKRSDTEEGTDEDIADDRERPITGAEFTFYDPGEDITPNMRIVEITNNDQTYDIEEVFRKSLKPPQEIKVVAFRQEFD